MNHDGFNAQLKVYIEEDEGKDISMDLLVQQLGQAI
jgi:hypothetical protein